MAALKSTLRETITEVLEEHDIDDADLVEDIVDRLLGVTEVFDDDDENAEEVPYGILGEDEE